MMMLQLRAASHASSNSAQRYGAYGGTFVIALVFKGDLADSGAVSYRPHGAPHKPH